MFVRFKNKLQEAGDSSTECMLKKQEDLSLTLQDPFKSQVLPGLPITLVLRRQRQEAFWTANLIHTDIQDQ